MATKQFRNITKEKDVAIKEEIKPKSKTFVTAFKSKEDDQIAIDISNKNLPTEMNNDFLNSLNQVKLRI